MFQRSTASFTDTWCTLRGRVEDYPVSDLAEFASPRIIEGCDAMDPRAVEAVLEKLRPDVVVNCVGLVKQRTEASDAVSSIMVNSLLPHVLSAKLDQWQGRLIHVSTDCVFDGVRGHYGEEDFPNAKDLYGRTKAMGDVEKSNTLVLRTSMVGRELRTHASLLDWFLRQRHRSVQGYRNAWWSGVTTNHLAGLIDSLITAHPDLAGLYHVSSGRISKYDLLLFFRDAFGLDVNIEPDTSYVLDRSLNGSKLGAAIGYRCPSWPDLLSELIADPTPYPIQ